MFNDPCFTAEVELAIPFHDVDMMGVAWHDNYFHYFEIARKVLLNRFDYGYRQIEESGYLWSVVDTRAKYRSALTFERYIRAHVQIKEYENRLRIGYETFDVETGRHAITDYTTQVAVDKKSRELYSVDPDILFERIGVTP